MPSSPHRRRRVRPALACLAALSVIATGFGISQSQPAHAAGEQVNVWLTTTNDSAGRNVTRGLQQQTPVRRQRESGRQE